MILQHTELSNAQPNTVAQTLQTGGEFDPVQRSDQTATAQPMSSEIIAAPCDGNPVSSATAAIAEKRLIFLSYEYIRVIPEMEMDNCVLQA